MIIFLSLLAFISAQVCYLNSPVGVWLKFNKTRCDTVIGHFILDETVYQHRELLYSTYRNLRRIEGCLLVTGYTGLTNLSFLSNLEEIFCDYKEAISSGLLNVIDIQTDKLSTMGLNSLKNVTGPGNIIMQFNKVSSMPRDSMERGDKCFSAEEVRFLANNPQFIGYMYKGCDNDNPCFSEDLYHLSLQLHRFTPASQIPPNCTIYYGSIVFKGSDTGEFANLHNLEIIIGKITVSGTLLDDLSMFQSLEIIYNNENSLSSAGNYALQLIEVTSAPFLANLSIPSLKNSRPLRWNYQADGEHLSTTGVIERVADPCGQMQQFKEKGHCERIYNTLNIRQPDEGLISFLHWEYLFVEIFTILGIFINFRAVLMLISMRHGPHLPSGRYLLALVATVNCLVSLERAIIYQRELKVTYRDYRPGVPSYYMPILQSSMLITPLLKWFSTACVGFKHAALVLIPICYLDYGIFFSIKHRLIPKISSLLTFLGFLSFIVLSMIFYYQLFVFTRIGSLQPEETEYGKPAQYYIFLVLHKDGMETSELLGGLDSQEIGWMLDQFGTSYSNDFSAIKDFTELIPDSLGQIFPNFVFYSDVIIAVFFCLFYIFYRFGYLTSGHSCWVLLLLYFELSSNRIRWYLRNDVLEKSYCPKEHYRYLESICGPLNEYNFWTMLLLEKLPYISAFLTAVATWRFAKYHLFLGAALYLQKMNSKRRREDIHDDISFHQPTTTKKSKK